MGWKREKLTLTWYDTSKYLPSLYISVIVSKMFISACQVITEYKLQAKQCAYVHSMTFMITEYFYHIRFEYVTFNIP